MSEMRLIGRIFHPLLLLLVATAFSACLEDYGTPAHQLVDVELSVRDTPQGALQNHATGVGTAQYGTSLVIAVPEGTPSTPRFEEVAGFDILLTRGSVALLDLGTSTVTLTVPVLSPIELFEYTFNDIFTLEQLLASLPIAGSPNRSAPFTIPSTVSTIVDVNLPLQFTSLSEAFSATTLDPLLWEPGIGDVVVAGGKAVFTASAAHDPAATLEVNRDGASASLRNNRNLLLNTQRVAGTVRIDSVTLSENPIDPDAVESRTHAQLIYQPRQHRGGGNLTNRTVVRLNFRQLPIGTTQVFMVGFICVTATGCTDPGELVGADAAHFRNFTATFPSLPSASFPFSLEYKGGGVFEGNVNGEIVGLDMSDLINPSDSYRFDANDFVFADLRAQGRFVFDSTDVARITAAYDNIQIGDPAFDPTAPVRLADSVMPYDDFFTGNYDASRWGELQGADIRNIGDVDQAVAGGVLTTDFFSANVNHNFVAGALEQGSELVIQPGLGVTGLALNSALTLANPGDLVQLGTSIEGALFKDNTGNIVRVRVGVFLDNVTPSSGLSWSAESCDPVTEICTPIGGAGFDFAYTSGNTAYLHFVRTGPTTFTFRADSTNAPGVQTQIRDLAVIAAGFVDNPITYGSELPAAEKRMGAFNFSQLHDPNLTTTIKIDDVDVDADNNGLMDNFDEGQPLFETFTASPLSAAKWENGEHSRTLTAGSLELSQINEFSGMDLNTATAPAALAADVRLTAVSGNGRAFLVNSLYEDATGVVIGTVGITATQAIATILHQTSAEVITVMDTRVIGPSTLAATHKLFMQWDGSIFTAQIDGSTPVTMNPASIRPIVNATVTEPFVSIMAGNIVESAPGLFGAGSATAVFDLVRAGKAVIVP